MSRRKIATVIAALALAVGAVALSGAAFVASSANPGNSISSAADWTPPTIGGATVATTSAGAPIGAGGAVKQGGTYRIYANVSDSGNPASGVSTVTADLSSISGSGSSTVALAACTTNCDVGGVTYGYVSVEKTVTNPLAPGSYGYTVTSTDGAGNSAPNSNFTVTVDNTAPTLSTLQMFDTDHNGKVDQVQATFNETLASSSATSPWTLTATPSGGSLASVGTSGSVATATITEGSSAADTSVGSFKVALASSSVGIRDLAGNQASFTSQAPADKAAPEAVSISRHTTSPSNAASVQFDVTFSESVTGVGTADFQVAASGVTGASVSGVTGTGASYTVTVGTGSGNGTVGLNLVDDDSIADSAANKLGGTGTGNGNLTGATYTIDKSAPQLSSLQMLDTNGNGKVDHVQATFDETLQTSTATAPWTLTNVPSGSSLSSVSTSGSVATLTLSEGASAADTSVGSFKVALSASSSGIRDQAGNQASFAATAPSDGAAPVVVSIARADSDPTQASTVHWTVGMSESVTGVDATDFALTGISGASISGVTGSGSSYTVTASTGSNEGSLGLNLVDDDSIADSASNKLGGTGTGNGNFTGQAYTIDRTAPSLQSLQMFDTDHDGKVDQVQATFSETLQSSTATAPWTLTNVPSGGSLSSVSTSGSVATLTLTEGTGAADTSVGSFTVALSASSTGIRDQAGNQASFGATAPADKAGPVPTAVTDTNGSTDGKFEQNDTMTVTFSESVTGVAATSNTVLTGGSGNGAGANDSLTAPGLLQLSSLGRSDYIGTNGSIANFNSSALSKPAANQVKLTLGACSDGTSGACGLITQAGGTGTFSVVPDSTITDAAGNGAAGTPTFTIKLF